MRFDFCLLGQSFASSIGPNGQLADLLLHLPIRGKGFQAYLGCAKSIRNKVDTDSQLTENWLFAQSSIVAYWLFA